MTSAAAFSEELATCLEDSEDEKGLNYLCRTCHETMNTIKPLDCHQASKEGQYWQAVRCLSTTLKTILANLPDGDELLQ